MATEKEERIPVVIPQPVIFFNLSHLCSAIGILRLLQMIGCSICLVMLLVLCQPSYNVVFGKFLGFPNETFLLLVNFGCFLVTTLLLVACVISYPTSTLLSKTIVDFLFNLVLFLLLLVATLSFFLSIDFEFDSAPLDEDHGRRIAISLVGIVNTALYGTTGLLSYRSCKYS